MNDLLTDWYFSRCVNLPQTQAEAFLFQLQQLRLTTLQPARQVEALQRLSVADARICVYAVPQLIKVAAESPWVDVRDAAAQTVLAVVEQYAGSSIRSIVADLVDLLERSRTPDNYGSGEAGRVLSQLEVLARAAYERELIDEHTAYFGVTSQLVHILFLAFALEFVKSPKSDSALGDRIRKAVDDEHDDIIASTVRTGAEGHAGRLPLKLSLALIATVVDGPTAFGLLIRAHADDDRASSLEPDLLAAAVSLQPDPDVPLEDLLRQEGLHKFDRSDRTSGPPPAVLRRLGISSEKAPVLRALIWQVLTICRLISEPDRYATELGVLLVPRSTPKPAIVRTPKHQGEQWLRDATALVAVSGVGGEGKAMLRAPKPKQKAATITASAHLIASPWLVPRLTDDELKYSSLGSLAGIIRLIIPALGGAQQLSRPMDSVSADMRAALAGFTLFAETLLDEKNWTNLFGPWRALVSASRASLGELTVGHVLSVSPDDLYGWIDDVVKATDREVAHAEVSERMYQSIVDRPLVWALAALPHIDDTAGPGRWSSELVRIVDFDVEPNDVKLLAAVLNDLLRHLGLPSSREHLVDGPAWADLVAAGSPGHHEILLAPTALPEEWNENAAEPLSLLSRAALAIRRLEALPHERAAAVEPLFAELSEALAAVIRARVDSFHVLVRAIHLLRSPAIRPTTSRVEQIAGLGIALQEPAIWRYVFDLALEDDAPLGNVEGTIWRLLASSLRQLQVSSLSDGTAARLRAIWRAAFARAVVNLDGGDWSDVRDLILDVADARGTKAAAIQATAVPVMQSGMHRNRIQMSSDPGRGPLWLMQGLVIDPVNDEHRAWMALRDTTSLDPGFPPKDRPRRQVVTRRQVGMTVSADNESVKLNVGEARMRSVPRRGTHVPVAGEPTIFATTGKNDRSSRALESRDIPGHPVVVTLRAERVGDGRRLRLQPHANQPWIDVDHRMWDADTSRAFSGADESKGLVRVTAALDLDREWSPFVQDGLTLVVEMASTGEPWTLVYNGQAERGWLFSVSPGVMFGLRPSDLSPASADALEQFLAETQDPNGLLVTFALGEQFDLSLHHGTHATDIHGALSTPFDERNIAWRGVIDEYLEDGVLLTSVNDAWSLSVAVPAVPFPSSLSLNVLGDVHRKPARDQARFFTFEDFDHAAQRSGRISAHVQPANTLSGEPEAVLAQLRASGDEEIVLARVLGYRPDGWVSCATKHGYIVNVRPESLSLAPLAPDSVTGLNIAGRVARLAPPRNSQSSPWASVAPAEANQRLAALLRGSSEPIVGLVWSKLKNPNAPAIVLVRFDLDGYPSVGLDFGERRIRVGDVVTVRLDGSGGPEVSVTQTFRIADVLHPGLVSGPLSDGSVYVGTMNPGTGSVTTAVMQSDTGTVSLAVVPSDLPLFSRRDKGRWEKPTKPWEEGCKVGKAAEGGRLEWIPLSSGGRFIGGSVRRPLSLGAATLSASRIIVRERLGRVTLSREFDVANVRVTSHSSQAPTRPQNRKTVAAQLDISAELARLAALGEPIDVEVEPRNPGRAYVSELLQLGCSRAEAALDVIDKDPTLVSAENYGSAGMANLVDRGEQQFSVSFRDVPDLDLEQFATRLGATLDQPVRPDRLTYAIESDGRHVFEFGYGLRVAADAAHLRFDDGPFDRVVGVLFHGDKIGRIVFTRIDDELVMVIQEASITASAGTVLFRQARDSKFLHLLRVYNESGDIRVRQIEGFSGGAVAATPRLFTGQPIARATVADPLSIEESLAPGSSRLIYGQLDTERFLESAGLSLVFNHRSITRDGIRRIGPEVVTFVRGGMIRSLGNELGLALLSASDSPEDLDKDAMVIRRNFSVDVSQLTRLKRLRTAAFLQGTLLVARIAPNDDPRVRSGIECRLHGTLIPNRSTSSLRDLARAENGLYLLVDTISKGPAASHVRLEYRHGIFFSLRPDEIESMPSNLARQDVVRLTADEDSPRFTLTRCSPSDRRFFGDLPRPMVALPINRLLARNAPEHADSGEFWKGAVFVAGGLPGELAAAASYSSGGWRPLSSKTLLALMRQQHPKVALFGVQGGRLTMAPPTSATRIGHLTVGRDGRMLVSVDKHEHAADPSLLTFADTSAADIVDRARAAWWQYHDESTGYWAEAGVVIENLGQHTVETGPVFFDEGYRLRYEGPLDRWSYSSAFLSDGVRQQGDRITCAVAGISVDAEGRTDGIYLEVAPGMICLVLHPLLRISLPGGQSAPLDQVSANSFAVGDMIDIRVVRDSNRSVDSIEVLRWAASGRAMGGSGRGKFVLPVVHFAEDVGELVLGAGDVHVSVPTRQKPVGTVVEISTANLMGEFKGSLNPGDSVLLIEEGGQLAVAGMSGVKVEPDGSMSDDVWHAHLFDKGRWIAPRLRNEVIAVGGAVAVTVEEFNPRSKRLKFSFRRQIEMIGEQRTFLTRVVGSLGGYFFLKAGSAVLRVDADRTVSGLSLDAIPSVADAMRSAGTIVWLTPSDDGLVALPELGREASGDRYVAEVDIDDEDLSGLVVRDTVTRALGWMPSGSLALAPLRPEDRQALWLGDGRQPFMALAVAPGAGQKEGPRTPAVSILGLPAVHREREGLRHGLVLGATVRAIAVRDGRKVLFAETLAGTIVELVCQQPGRVEVGQQVAVEVVSIDMTGTEVVVVPVGERKLELALPHLLMDDLPAPGEPRAAFTRWLRLLDGERDEGPEEDIQLAEAFRRVSTRVPSAHAASVAVDWWRTVRRGAELELLPILMVAYLLLRAALASPKELAIDSGTDDEGLLRDSKRKWEKLAGQILASVGRRSLRSLHVETLMRYWLKQRLVHEGIAWDQWEFIAARAAKPLGASAVAALESMLRQLQFGGGREGDLVAAAIQVASGSGDAGGILLEDDDLLLPELVRHIRIIDPYLTGVVKFRPADALEVQMEFIRGAIDRMRRQGDDVILLAEPPWFERK